MPIEKIDPSLKPGDVALIDQTPQGYIYELPGAMPRVLFATSARRADFRDLLASGHWPGVDLRSTVLLDGDAPIGPARQPGTVRLLQYTNTEVVIEARSAAGGWVVLNDIWHPWWAATVDGEPVDIKRANVLFRAVRVKGGRRVVRFEFRPIRGALTALLNWQ